MRGPRRRLTWASSIVEGWGKVVKGIQVLGPRVAASDAILTPDALAFVADLHRTFDARRLELLAARRARQARLDAGERPRFHPETADVRAGHWRVAPVPADLQDRRVEITGPVERKMVINALNSGARTFMADFEDAHSPTWEGTVQGQQNLMDAIERTIEVKTEAKTYTLNEKTAVLLVRPRGWHLHEKHLLVDGAPMSASLFDLGLYFFHNHARLKARGTGPYFYLPKMESHLEARLWNDVFVHAQRALGVPVGTIKATVLVETILAAFEMDEILHELREHSAGLNAGRWDYIFSIIKKFRNTPLALPDRAAITMTVPFMRAYTQLLVHTCHKRGAHAMGGMAAFVPSRKDAKVNENALKKVREDKVREVNDGFDGTWVAHPDLVPVATEVFDGVLGAKPNQVEKQVASHVKAEDLLNFAIPDAKATEAGLRNNVDVALQYLDAWLRGNGAVAIHNLMEDAATAEISRSQVWQWVHHGVFAREMVEEIMTEITDDLDSPERSRLFDARRLFEEVALADDFPEFLTLPAYDRLEG
jgi:malate synthase